MRGPPYTFSGSKKTNVLYNVYILEEEISFLLLLLSSNYGFLVSSMPGVCFLQALPMNSFSSPLLVAFLITFLNSLHCSFL